MTASWRYAAMEDRMAPIEAWSSVSNNSMPVSDPKSKPCDRAESSLVSG
ncbi:hypothetical protein ACFROC_19195 [Nocardia tengchongensis]